MLPHQLPGHMQQTVRKLFIEYIIGGKNLIKKNYDFEKENAYGIVAHVRSNGR